MHVVPQPARFFEQVPDGNVKKLVHALGTIEALVHGLIAGEIPSEGYTLADLMTFAKTAVAGQREADPFALPGSWALVESIEGMGQEARQDFIMRPTWLVTAVLAHIRTCHPGTADQVPGLDAAVRAGARFSVLNHLRGHGYEAMDEALAGVRLFGECGLIAYAVTRPGEFPEFLTCLVELEAHCRQALATLPAEPGWGEPSGPALRQALGLLAPVAGLGARAGT